MTVEIVKGDITEVKADAIVNAANSSLLGGGGVDGAIHRKGGKAILEACVEIRNRQGKCKTGEAVITTGGNLRAKFVIHTVGPVWNGENQAKDRLLESCYRNSLLLAVEHNLEVVAFPNISTGIYHFPKERAANIAINAVLNFSQREKLKHVIFVCFDDENYECYQTKLKSDYLSL